LPRAIDAELHAIGVDLLGAHQRSSLSERNADAPRSLVTHETLGRRRQC
jgi:hypothetical protein